MAAKIYFNMKATIDLMKVNRLCKSAEYIIEFFFFIVKDIVRERIQDKIKSTKERKNIDEIGTPSKEENHNSANRTFAINMPK